MHCLRDFRRLGLLLIIALCIGAITELNAGAMIRADASEAPKPSLLSSESLVHSLQLPVRLDLASAGIGRGLEAVDFTLADALGRQVSLSSLLTKRPVVLILGSYT